MGYSLEEIASGTAQYLGVVGSASTRQRIDYVNLAAESARYLENLKLITAFTGEDAKKAQAEADRLATNAAVDARIREEELRGNKEIRTKFDAAIKSVPASMRDMVAQSFGMYGVVLGDNAIVLAQSTTLTKQLNSTVADITNKNVSLSELTTRSINSQIKNGSAIDRELRITQGRFGIAAEVDNNLRNASQTMQSLSTTFKDRSKIDAETLKQQLVNAKAAGTTPGDTAGYAKTIITAQEIQMKVQTVLDKVITQFDVFADVSKKIIDQVSDALKKAGFAMPSTPEDKPPGAKPFDPAAIQKKRFSPKPGEKAPLAGGTPPGANRTRLTSQTFAGGVEPTLPAGLSATPKMGAGQITPELQRKLALIARDFPSARITGMNDAEFYADHAAPNKHGLGRAVDFTIPNYDVAQHKKYKSQLEAMGFTYVKDHYKDGGGTGQHLHAEFKDGGITNGPSLAGEAGPEAVIPLPNGRTIPVKMDVGELVEKMEELISVSRDQLSTSEKILSASA
jgi:hypothetical protein